MLQIRSPRKINVTRSSEKGKHSSIRERRGERENMMAGNHERESDDQCFLGSWVTSSFDHNNKLEWMIWPSNTERSEGTPTLFFLSSFPGHGNALNAARSGDKSISFMLLTAVLSGCGQIPKKRHEIRYTKLKQNRTCRQLNRRATFSVIP